MMAKGHAVGGAAVWLTGWSWPTMAGLVDPGIDVLTIGTLVCAGAALLPDLDHPRAKLAQAGGVISRKFAEGVGRIGAGIHAATKLDADKTDRDGHRTITHTTVFALFAGTMTTGVAGLSDDLGAWLERTTAMPINPLGGLLTALIVFAFVQLGAATIRSNFGGRRTRVALLPPAKGRKRGRLRVHKSTAIGLAAAVAAYAIVPADVWWLGLAVGTGCFAHCLGDLVTVGGCPILWPLPIPTRKVRLDRQTQLLVLVTRYDKQRGRRVPVWQWRTWYLVGTPPWMRFRVNSPTELIVTRCLMAWCLLAVAGLVYGIGWVPEREKREAARVLSAQPPAPFAAVPPFRLPARSARSAALPSLLAASRGAPVPQSARVTQWDVRRLRATRSQDRTPANPGKSPVPGRR